MTYTPRLLDTSNLQLPAEVVDAVEKISENNHALWAIMRLKEGWRHGKALDGDAKTHPGLVPYDKLPESEKEYDRQMVEQMLKSLMCLGYRITREPSLQRPADASSPSLPPWLDVTGGMEVVALPHLIEIWRYLATTSASLPLHLYTQLGNAALDLGEPLLALDILQRSHSVPRHSEDTLRLHQLIGLALARSGALAQANIYMAKLYEDGFRDGETLGILAATWKRLWEDARSRNDPACAEQCLAEAHRVYLMAYEQAREGQPVGDVIYAGINAASTARFAGNEPPATLLDSIASLCQRRLQSGTDYWASATLAELALLRDTTDEARDLYQQAVQLAPDHFGNISSTRRQARQLLAAMGHPQHLFDDVFAIPDVLVFSGHMMARHNRKNDRLAVDSLPGIRQAIRTELNRVNARIGYASAACGADILFLEEMQRRRAETHVVLPYPPDPFIEASVAFAGQEWVERFRAIIAPDRVTSLTVVSDEPVTGSHVAGEYANLALDGLAALRAQQLCSDVLPLTVWDETHQGGQGGTASMVRHWRGTGLTPVVIPLQPAKTSAEPVSNSRGEANPQPTPEANSTQEIRAILLADAASYGALGENQIHHFACSLLNRVAALVAAAATPPLSQNTWGDALYFVFGTVAEAGRFALLLRDQLADIVARDPQLPDALQFRYALHAGPVFCLDDPVTGRQTFLGKHVVRAARIEPVTVPGEVYASEEFAALAAAERICEFGCEYVGRVPWAKGIGTYRTYRILKKG